MNPLLLTILILSVLLIALAIVITVLVLKNRKTTMSQISLEERNITFQLSPKTTYLTEFILRTYLIEVAEKWISKKDWNKSKVWAAMSNQSITFYDQNYLEVPTQDGGTRKVGGASWPTYGLISITTLPTAPNRDIKGRVKSLLQHEISHPVYVQMTGSLDEDEAHTAFKEIGV